MANQVAVDLNKDGEFVTAELVSTNRGWATVLVDGEERKVRIGQVAMGEDGEPVEELTDDAEVRRGDVFPEGIRETYVKGKTEEGVPFIDCNDEVAEQLRGMSIEAVAKVAEQILGERTQAGWLALYTTDREAEGKTALNPGMVRMNLGNRIRAALKRQAEEAQGQ